MLPFLQVELEHLRSQEKMLQVGVATFGKAATDGIPAATEIMYENTEDTQICILKWVELPNLMISTEWLADVDLWNRSKNV